MLQKVILLLKFQTTILLTLRWFETLDFFSKNEVKNGASFKLRI